MTLTTQGIVDRLNTKQLELVKANGTLSDLQRQLEEIELYKQIKELEKSKKLLEKEEAEIREEGKQIMLSNGLKKFEALDGTTIQLNKKPGALVIEDESIVPQEYKKEKVTISIDKTLLKKDISEGLLIDGVYIKEDYTLVIKN